jgi:chromosomal replication initiator protein
LIAKAKEEKVHIPNEVFDLIADSIERGIRSLENALNRVIAVHQLEGREITLDMAKRVLRPMFSEQGVRNVSFEDILRETSNVFKLSQKDIRSKSRTSQINHARQIVMLLAKNYIPLSNTEIAGELDREHPTIISGIRHIEREIQKDTRLKEKHDEIIENLKKR